MSLETLSDGAKTRPSFINSCRNVLFNLGHRMTTKAKSQKHPVTAQRRNNQREDTVGYIRVADKHLPEQASCPKVLFLPKFPRWLFSFFLRLQVAEFPSTIRLGFTPQQTH